MRAGEMVAADRTSPAVTAAFARRGAHGVLALLQERGGPIVEASGNPDSRLVTFVFSDETAAARTPAVVCPALPNKSILLRRLGASTVFVATAEVPAGSLVGYSYVVEPPPALLAGEDGGFVEAFAIGRPDPFKPLKDAVSLPQIRFEYEYSVLALDGTYAEHANATTATPQGAFDEWIVSSRLLGNDRAVRVYRPASDHATAAARTLVVVLGAAEEWWPAGASLDSLAARASEPFLGVLVGTRGFVSRHRELAGNDTFVAFARHELLPFLSARYHVRESGHVVAGASVGGVGAAFLALRDPDAFSRAAVVSGTFQATPAGSPLPWKSVVGRERPVLDAYERHAGRFPARAYVSVGRFETYRRVDMHADGSRLASILARRGVDVRFDDGYTAHDTIALRRYLSTGLAWLLGADG